MNCGKPIDVPMRGQLPAPKRCTHVCDARGLPLDRFIEQVGSGKDIKDIDV
jgi:hypothetical protein